MPGTHEWWISDPPLTEAMRTGVDAVPLVARDHRNDDVAREAWQKLIDDRLIKLGSNPSEFDDEDVQPPSAECVRLAIQLAQALQQAGMSPPDSVVRDANGGIVFERRRNDVAEVYHVWDDGAVEYQRFQETHLVERRTLLDRASR